MTTDALRNEICRVASSLYVRGYVHSTAGNISVRLDDGGFLITPTDACLGSLDPGALAEIDAQGRHLAGQRPSKSLSLHRRIYAADPAARCVIHTHSTHLVALSMTQAPDQEFLPPITPYFIMKVGHVPLIPYHRPGDPGVGDLVAACIDHMLGAGTPIRAVMLQRLGPKVWHRTPAEAGALLEELEETARLWWMTRAEPLPDRRIDELRQSFGAAW